MQKRIVFSVVLSILLILVSLGVISSLQVRDSITRSSADQLALAEMMRSSLEQILQSNLARLYDLSLAQTANRVDGAAGPMRSALQSASQYSLFTDGLFLLDTRGRVRASYPYPDPGVTNLIAPALVTQVLHDRRPVITDIVSTGGSGRKVIFVLVPLKNREDAIIGAAAGAMSPTNYLFTQIMKSLPATADTVIELADSQGLVIASSNPQRVLTGTDHNRFLGGLIAQRKSSVMACHRCHDGGEQKSRDILAFTPLSLAPWGVLVRVPEERVFASSTRLKHGFLVLGGVSVVAAILLTLGMTRSIVKPVRQLIAATQKVARGNLTEPVNIPGTDEIGFLARSFDDMRAKLDQSLAMIHEYSVGLEHRVYERTRQLEEKQRKNKMLLKKVITTQEDERKRIARELHDDTLQSLSAVLMRIEMCRLHPDQITPEKIETIKQIINGVITGMNRLVQNLRPTMLDDLGFGSSVVWLLDRNLKDKGITVHLDMEQFEERVLSPEREITLFRIIQEASFNIARHSGAQNAFITIRTEKEVFFMSIEDDGEGFDTETVFENTLTGRGIGILGMKERAALLNGTLTVCSAPGYGTWVECRIPLSAEV